GGAGGGATEVETESAGSRCSDSGGFTTVLYENSARWCGLPRHRRLAPMRTWLTGLIAVIVHSAACGLAQATITLDNPTLTLDVGGADQLHVREPAGPDARWTTSDPTIAEVYQNGFVVALRPGPARIG